MNTILADAAHFLDITEEQFPACLKSKLWRRARSQVLIQAAQLNIRNRDGLMTYFDIKLCLMDREDSPYELGEVLGDMFEEDEDEGVDWDLFVAELRRRIRKRG